MKICSSCKKDLPRSNFTLDNRSKDKLKSDCKGCRSNYMKNRRLRIGDRLRAQSKQWAKNNPSKIQDLSYKKYGISLDIFTKMVENQKGECLLCKRIPKGKLVVDHDHVTGRIRGLLCRSCNGALGVLGDSVDRLSKVIKYLENK